MRGRYVSVTEAATLVGKSEMTIRRLMKEPESKLHLKQEGGKALISEPYLLSRYPAMTREPEPETQVTRESHESNTANKSESDVSHMFANVIQAKDDLIKVLQTEVQTKDRIIDNLMERGREQNIIIQSLQDKVRTLPPYKHEEAGRDNYTSFEKVAFVMLILLVLTTLFFVVSNMI